jgi:hypothetical protein
MKKWKQAGSDPKKLLLQKIWWKRPRLIFWEKDGVIFTDYMQQGKSVRGGLLLFIVNKTSSQSSGNTTYKCSKQQAFICLSSAKFQ